MPSSLLGITPPPRPLRGSEHWSPSTSHFWVAPSLCFKARRRAKPYTYDFKYITIPLYFQNCGKSQTCALRKNWMEPKVPKSRVPSPWFLGKKMWFSSHPGAKVVCHPHLLSSMIAFITPTLFLAVCLLQCRCFTFTSIGTSRENVSIFSIQLFESIKTWVSTVYLKCHSNCIFRRALMCAKHAQQAPYR